MDAPTMEEVEAIVELIRRQDVIKPQIGLVLGSGLGPLADSVQEPVRISSHELEGWPESSIEGHAGELVFGRLEGQAVCVIQGRVHFYEGRSMQRLAVPVRVLRRLGAHTLIVTNAAGGLNPDFAVGDVMLINDHIFLPGMAGHTPLRGPNPDGLGPRFPDMSQAYDRDLQELARQVAHENDITLREGLYMCLAGPSFETPAELRFIRLMGADSVGMSTANEVTVARHAGMRVMGFSGITNMASMDGSAAANHEEVLEAGQIILPKLDKLIRGVLRKL